MGLQCPLKPPSHLIIWLDGSQFHHQLKTEQVVSADWLELQQFTESHQLGALQVLQRQLVLKQLGESYDVFSCGLLACTPYLAETHNSTSENTGLTQTFNPPTKLPLNWISLFAHCLGNKQYGELQLTLWTNVENLWVSSSVWALALFLRAISAMVSWRNLASSSLAARPFFCFSSCKRWIKIYVYFKQVFIQENSIVNRTEERTFWVVTEIKTVSQ